MGLHTQNETCFRTSDLRALIAATVRACGVDMSRTVKVKWTKRSGIHGNAYLHFDIATMLLSYDMRKQSEWTPEQIKKFAQILVHELDHNGGLRHSEMVDWWDFEVPWCEGMSVRRKEQKPKTLRNVVAERAAHARGKLAEHEKKLKREQKIVKKWRTKVRYYARGEEKKRAANPPAD